MQARMSNPATILPDASKAIYTLVMATKKGGVPETTLELVHLRASQINGCSFCVDSGARSARKAGETDERLFAVAAWGSYASSLIVEIISSVENVLINSRCEGIFFTPAQDELESANLRMSQVMCQFLDQRLALYLKVRLN